METCVTCAKSLACPIKKVCHLCGYPFMGQGWCGAEFHWKVRHRDELTHSAYWAGLCESYRHPQLELAELPALADPRQPGASRPNPSTNWGAGGGSLVEHSVPGRTSTGTIDPLDMAFALRCSHMESILIQTLVTEIAEELWSRDHLLDLEVLKDVVGDSGFDLVIRYNGSKRYIQIKQTRLTCNPEQYSLWHDFSKTQGGCAVVLVHGAEQPGIEHYLFFGGGSGDPLPPILGFPKTQSPARRAVDAIRKVRENLFNVPRHKFQGPLGIPELVDRLFPKPTKQKTRDQGLGQSA